MNSSELALLRLDPALQADVAPSRTELLYAALNASNEAILRSTSPAGLYQRVCDAVVGSGLFAIASVLLPRADAPDRLDPIATNGGANIAVSISTDPALPEGRGLAGTAFNTGLPCISRDLASDPRLAPWRAITGASGLRAGAAVPLTRAGQTFGVLLLHSFETAAFDPGTVAMLERVAENICFALRNFEQEQTLSRFRTAMDLSSDAIYLTDPETLRFIDANETAVRRVGYSRAELLTMGPLDVTHSSREELVSVFAQAIACAPEPVVTLATGHSRSGQRWMAELSRRAVLEDGRWMIVTISRDIDTQHREESLRTLQHRVTRRLAQSGALQPMLAAVLGEIGIALDLDDASCLGVESTTPRRLGGWHRPNALPPPEFDALDALALAFGAPVGSVGQTISDARHLTAVPMWVDGKTLGALVLHGRRELQPEATRALVGIAELVGQFISRKQAEDVLAHSEARFRALTDLSSDWYWESDDQQRFVSFGGRRVKEVLDHEWHRAFVGRTLWALPNMVADSADFDAQRAQLMRRERFRDFQFAVRESSGELRWISASGEPRFDADGCFVGYHGVARDITTHRRAEASIRHLATHDILTGLPNRALFSEVLAKAIAEARNEGGKLALLFVDLDHFKIINDTLGHEAGDQMLQQMARALGEGLRTSDLVARLGGDEFVVLLRNPDGAEEARTVAQKLLAATTRPLLLGGQECRVSASIGICMFPQDAADELALMKGADIAMYQAKREGRNAFRFYSADGPPQSIERLRMETNLRVALERNELHLHYQPKVDLASGQITGVEALLRWTSAELGIVPPGDFIPLAEEIGLMHTIGRWVLNQACGQHAAWRRAGLAPVHIAVNLSPRQFEHDDLVTDIERSLHDAGMPGDALELEITESAVVANPARALKTLKAIKRMGVRLAIDDFGTGYSSLAQLKHFPIDTLKIDRSFISSIPADPQDMAITQAIVVMARTLRLTVVAEGVETSAQREFLRGCGCAQMQGYLYSKPLAPDQLAALMRRPPN